MGVKLNPFTGKLDVVDSPSGDFSDLDVSGDITLDDGGTYTTTVQVVTPTADRTISFPDATGTVALVAGSTGQVTYNDAGAQAGLASANIGSTGEIDVSLAGAASTPPVTFTGSWFTGGTATTTKPQLLIEPSGTTSTAWSTNGTGLGVNAASGFGGNLLDLQENGSSKASFDASGNLRLGGSTTYYFTAQQGRIGVFNTETSRLFFQFANYQSISLGADVRINWTSVNGQAAAGTIDTSLERASAGVVKIADGSTGTGYIKQVPVLVSQLPAPGTVGAGTRGFVSDATSTTFAAAPVGGGANTVPVYSDGTNWLIG